MLKSQSATSWESDDGYPQLEALVSSRVAALSHPLFTTDPAANLFDVFLSHLPPERRQHYTCRACQKFFDRYGGIVAIGEHGDQATPIWGPDRVPEFFALAVGAVREAVDRAKVVGVFLSSETTWGVPQSGGWTHLCGRNPVVYTGKLKTADQTAAERAGDHAILCRSLADFSEETAAQAVRILDADALDRSEKTLGVAKWFLALRRAWGFAKGSRRTNVAWRAAATAPPGWCHVRSSMIGTLLEDLQSGMDFDAVKARWSKKMHPLQYQRPTAAPSGGAIREAERLVAATGADRSLARRFATLDDVLVKLWVPRPVGPELEVGGVFGHLRKERVAEPLELPKRDVTWEKFATNFLPTATSIEVLAPSHGGYYGLLTAADPDAPPIIQWDGLEGHPRNPVSWYFYSRGSSAAHWGLTPGWTPVSAVFLGPHRWQEPAKFAHQGDKAFFALAGCRESDESDLCLFPEILKAEYRAIRSVIEAHSKSRHPIGREAGNANGLAFQRGNPSGVTVRVATPEGKAVYKIDRWD